MRNEKQRIYDIRWQKANPEFAAWSAMKARCLNPKHPAYQSYGGRGITVAPEWVHDFKAFLAHVGKRPGPTYSLDRINSDGNYEPGNVRWASLSEQNRNKRRRPSQSLNHLKQQRTANGQFAGKAA